MEYKFKELIGECKKGNKAAVEELIRKVKPLVLKVVASGFFDNNTRDDMIQQGYLIVLETIKSFDDTKNRPYLAYLKSALYYGICKKTRGKEILCLNDRAGEDMEIIDMLADDSKEADEVIIDMEEHERLHRAIDMLTERQREVIIQRFFCNMSLKDISGSMGLAYITVLTIQKKALYSLKRLMETM